MRSRPLPLFGLGLLVGGSLLPIGGAWAQTVSAGSERLVADVHVREEYDSNLSGGNEAFASLRDVRQADWSTSLGASVTANLPSGRRLLYLKGAFDTTSYQRNTQLNNTSVNFAAGVQQGFHACVANANVAYSRQLTPGNELIIAVDRNITADRTVSGGLTCTRGHLQASAQGRYSRVTNSANSSGLLDYDSWGADGTVGYTDHFFGSLSFLGGYNKVSYDTGENTAPLFVSGYRTTNFGVRYSRAIGLRLSGTADFTYQTAESDIRALLLSGVARQKHSGLSASVAMAYQLGRRTQLNFAYSHGVTPQTQLNTGFDVTDSFRFSASHTIGQRISLSASASQVNTDYGGVFIGTLQPLESDRVRSVSGSASVKIGRHLRLSADAEHQNRRGNLSIYDYSSDRVGISLAGVL